jgi:hypothetical protein
LKVLVVLVVDLIDVCADAKLSERMRAEMRAEFFDLFNHAT